MSLENEFHEMKKLAELIITDSKYLDSSDSCNSVLQSLSGTNDQNLLIRLRVLNYGYGARTHQTLSQHFERFKKKLEDSKWNKIGTQYSYNEANKIEQLGMLPESFFKFCLLLDLDQAEIKELMSDYGLWKSQNAYYNNVNALYSLSQLSNDEGIDSSLKLRFQDSCIVLKISDLQLIVVSRSKEEFFIELVNINDFPFKLYEEKIEFNLDQIVDLLQSTEKVAQFFNKMIKCQWLLITK